MTLREYIEEYKNEILIISSNSFIRKNTFLNLFNEAKSAEDFKSKEEKEDYGFLDLIKSLENEYQKLN